MRSWSFVFCPRVNAVWVLSRPLTACLLYVPPQPVAEASVKTTACLDTCSRGTPAHRNEGSDQGLKVWRQYRVMNTRCVPLCHAHLGTRPCSQRWSGLIWSNLSSVTAAVDAENGTNGTTDVPAVGQRGGTQGLNSGGAEVARSGVCVSSATLTWFQGGAGGVSKGLGASSNHTTLTAGEQCWHHFLMHFRKERYWGGALRTSTGHPKKPIVQPRVLRTRWRVPLESDTRGGPGKHSIHLWVGLRPRFHTQRGQRSRIFTIDIWYSGGAPKVTNGIARSRSASPPLVAVWWRSEEPKEIDSAGYSSL